MAPPDLDSDQRRLVVDNWRHIKGKRKEEEFTDNFYGHLFEIAPHLRSLFKQKSRMKLPSIIDFCVKLANDPTDVKGAKKRIWELGAK